MFVITSTSKCLQNASNYPPSPSSPSLLLPIWVLILSKLHSLRLFLYQIIVSVLRGISSNTLMASLSSFPFSIEGAIEGSASARNRLLAAIGQARPLESVSFTNWRNGSVRLLRRSVRAVGRDSVGGEREKASVDLIQETIEKSKQVLAIQKELLQQIAERRKLVASIRNGINDVGGGISSSQESENSSPSLPVSSNRPVSDQVYANGSSPTPSIPSELPANPASGFSDSSGESEGRGVETPRKVGVDQAKIPSNDKSSLDSGSAVKTEEIRSTLPASLSLTYESSISDNVLEESIAGKLPSDTDEPAPEDNEPPPLAGANVMNVIMVAAECAPFSKTGGLGDVAGSLPKALARRGHRVMVVAPKYGDYPEAEEIGVVKKYMVAGQDVAVSYFHAYIDGVDFVFIENHMFHGIEKNIYGGTRQEILKRMVLLCKAAVEVPWHVPCGGVCYGDGNLVFIANDWHTALLPVYLKAYYREKGLMTYTRSILVIHNIAHQGRGPLSDFSFTDLPQHWLNYFKLDDPVGGVHCNIFAAGLRAADRIVTVSHGYASEIRTLEGGRGLQHIINENDWKLRGIVNGIDTKEWSPEYDIYLQSDGYTNYSLETLQVGKAQCKAALQKELGLPQREDFPLIGFIGRLDDQKGVDLIAEAVPWMMSQDVQLVMLGSGKPELEQMLRRFEDQYYEKARGWVGFSVKTAHRITAGADILLMPSRFEPCGLNQLYAMNYGTIPVVHAVGGLKDTVLPFDPFKEEGFGYTFHRAESGKLIEALGNCLLTYREYKESWEGLQRRAMTQDLSWDHAAEIYEEVLVAAKYQW